MCSAPPWRTLFRHLDDIWSSRSAPTLRCFVHLDLRGCFAQQRRACVHLISGQLAKHPAVWASLLFDPPEPQKHWIKTHNLSRLPYLFAHLYLLSSDFLHLLSSPLWLSPRPIFFLGSASSWLCLSSVHIVGSFTFKLPSIMCIYIFILLVMICMFTYIYIQSIIDLYCYNILYLYIYIHIEHI